MRSKSMLLLLWLVGMVASLGNAEDFTWELTSSTTNWNSAANWAGPLGGFPNNNTDSATIAGPATNYPVLTSNTVVGSLTIGSGTLANGPQGEAGHALTVQSSNFQNGMTSILESGNLFIRDSPVANDFDTDDLTIDGGQLTLDGGKAQVDDQLVLINGGWVGGNGILELNGGQHLFNDGCIVSYTSSGPLVIQGTGNERIDLDGTSGNGIISAIPFSQLIIDMPAVNSADAFDGEMRISEGAEIQINHNWELRSQIDFFGESGKATQSGNPTTYSGIVNVNSGTAVLAADSTTVLPGATINVAPDTTLRIESATDILEPEALNMSSGTTLFIDHSVSIGSGDGFFDWDGPGDVRTRVASFASLIVDVGSIDASGAVERFDGTLMLDGGLLRVENDAGQWEMAGTLEMNYLFTGAAIRGAEMLVTGELTSFALGQLIEAPVIFGATSRVEARLGGGVVLRGPTAVINGGEWTGDGYVSLDADVTTVAAATTVDMPGGTFDLDNPVSNTTVILDAPLTLNVAAVDLDAGQNIGDAFEINPSGRLTVNFTNPSQDYRFVGTLALNGLSGGLASLHLDGGDVQLDGITQVTGNSIANSRVDMLGAMTLASGATFNVAGGTLDLPSTVQASATFSGAGELVVATSGHLALADGADVGVDVINRGRLEVGSSPGAASVAWLDLEASGIYEVEIDGLVPGSQFDRLTVMHHTALGGSLEILINENGGSYADPNSEGTFDQFALILSGSSSGSFDDFSYGGSLLALSFAGAGEERFHIDDGLFRILRYEEEQTSLLNYKALGGDANGDGIVDGQDFVIWNTNKFANGTDWTTGDFNGDGITDGQDFVIWNSNKFMSVDFITAIPEPVTGWVVWWVVVLRHFRFRDFQLRRFSEGEAPVAP